MRIFITATLLALASVAAIAQEKTYGGRKLKTMTPEEEREWMIKRASNVAIQRFPNAGKIVFVNLQKTVPADSIHPIISDIRDRTGVDVELANENVAFNLSEAATQLKAHSATGAIYIIDDPTLPMSLVSAESHWGVVNVAPLKADDAMTVKRTQKEAWRVFGMTFGASDSTYGGCVLAPVSKAADLDAILAESINPAFDRQIIKHLKGIGMKPSRKTTYSRACQEGWAAAPTNKYQQAIWDKVHSIPDKPLKIEFDPAAQKGKVTK